MGLIDLISEFNDGFRFVGIWSSPSKYAQQYRVYNKEDVVKLLSIFDGSYNCGISMCTFIDNIPHLLYLAFDFDSENHDPTLEEGCGDKCKYKIAQANGLISSPSH